MIFSDIHVHTKYCDGKNTAEDIVRKAVDIGLKSIGFSGHAYTEMDSSFCMTKEDTEKYIEEIKALKDKYTDIDVLLGIEKDYYSSDDYKYDYVIGSLHYVERDGVPLSVDDTAEVMENNVQKYFGGDYREYVKSYYEDLKDVVRKTSADVVGHFDLITKFNEGNKYFDEDADWYKECALDALREIAKSKPIFEVNTGAICRGYRSTPYPAKFILEEIKNLGCDVVLTSDCHDLNNLGYAFDEALNIVKECGFETVKVLTKNGFREAAI